MTEQGRTEPSTALEFARVGLSWDPAHGRRWYGARRAAVDLNVAAVLLSDTEPLEVVYHQQLISADGAVRLLGDSVTGEDEGDDEIITLGLSRIRPEVNAVAVVVTCYSGQTFADVANPRCRIVDGAGAALADHDLSARAETGMIAGIFRRTGDGWTFRAVATGITAAHPVEALPQLPPLL
ncbi:putative stress response protein [Nocardia nova SH22a]|uniref:Putative stress response protein n=1 Tax=Nocardia nova SH22a TaxID=1415166 RepID=W5TAD4_9NOCA|nr:TerD family protein [Nocardia nova]AHH16162.1 putative stress response protein [Nocardia nova SH22a]